MRTIAVSEFKAKCLQILAEVQARGDEIVVTKRGQPIARVLPLVRARGSARGILAGRASIRGDVVRVDWSREWEAGR